jgi:hypothetical protein
VQFGDAPQPEDPAFSTARRHSAPHCPEDLCQVAGVRLHQSTSVSWSEGVLWELHYKLDSQCVRHCREAVLASLSGYLIGNGVAGVAADAEWEAPPAAAAAAPAAQWEAAPAEGAGWEEPAAAAPVAAAPQYVAPQEFAAGY